MPVRILVTSGTVADCMQAGTLIQGLSAEHLLADRGYDSDAIVAQAQEQGIKAVIPPRRNRKVVREYGKALYKVCHLASARKCFPACT